MENTIKRSNSFNPNTEILRGTEQKNEQKEIDNGNWKEGDEGDAKADDCRNGAVRRTSQGYCDSICFKYMINGKAK